MKNTIQNNWFIAVASLAVYMVGFQHNEGLQNIGSFVLWALGVLVLAASVWAPSEALQKQTVLKKLLWLVVILAMAYKGMFLLSAIYMTAQLTLFARRKQLTVK